MTNATHCTRTSLGKNIVNRIAISVKFPTYFIDEELTPGNQQ